MIHDSSYFLLKQNKTNTGNIDDDIVGSISFNGTSFSNKGSTIFGLQTKAKKSSKNPNVQTRVHINYATPSFQNERIIILLESPSNDEFLPPTPQPANGTTGFRINSQFLKLINNYINVCFPTLPLANTIFDVAIVNSIRYQCDLGYAGNRTNINSVFQQLWNKQSDPFSDDLLERIKIIKPVLIINACSKCGGLKLCSTSFLKTNLSGLSCNIVETTVHASKWCYSTNIS